MQVSVTNPIRHEVEHADALQLDEVTGVGWCRDDAVAGVNETDGELIDDLSFVRVTSQERKVGFEHRACFLQQMSHDLLAPDAANRPSRCRPEDVWSVEVARRRNEIVEVRRLQKTGEQRSYLVLQAFGEPILRQAPASLRAYFCVGERSMLDG
jgi:hypothetical protein